MERLHRQSNAVVAEHAALTKATVRAAGKLALNNRALASIIGVSEPSISRMKKGEFQLERGQKPFELGVLFVRLYRSLDAIVGGDEQVAQAWLRNQNTALGGVPLTLIRDPAGLVRTVDYLDAARARI